eukprot:gnl/MRDRNA2_/MRDRNA2_91494_c0_seq1.p1 gnl/MRDRNA2_/MRDRNA2_91494_c0~~gnl/MRDRNA2_/MRDRNA2_91494_c0_seq1.p1  ORF type:complete len:781 (-),score=132.85 gnl/MRDRNA2_/MRDRNA2_91494_c0_seq1:157-2499(-)
MVADHTPSRKHLAERLLEKGFGNLLRGWRLELDPDSSLTCGYQEFCRAAEHIGFREDINALFAMDGDASTLNFGDIAPEEYRILSLFKEWIKVQFGGPTEWIEVFDPRSLGLSQEEFVKQCRYRGFNSYKGDTISDEALVVLFQGIDLNACGRLQCSEIPFLELDARVREQELFHIKQLKIEEERKRLTRMLEEGRALAKKLSPAHRLAQRPWLESHYAKMPSVVKQRRSEIQATLQNRKRVARELFMQHIQSTYGNPVRAWRTGLDPQGAFVLNETDVRCYCRRIDFGGDARSLWLALDRDGDGVLEFEELCLRPADALASFRTWVHRRYIRCVDLWERSSFQRRRQNVEKSPGSKKWVSDKKMLLQDFHKALVDIDFPEAKSKEHMRLLLTSLDEYGCGFISLSDLEWLDSWQPAEWLSSTPDEKSWLDLRRLLIRKYEHLLHAWRSTLDTDGSNRVSWREFKTASEKLNFKGNIGGAWRWLDTDLSGWISLQEVDPPSFELLQSFKNWADANFGSVRLAFQALDADGGGTLSFSELRRACRKWRWEGEVRLLFDCLDIDSDGPGRRQISVHEISFLDNWEALDPILDAINQDRRRAPAPKVKQCTSAKTPNALSQPQLPSLSQSTMHVQRSQPKYHPEKASVKQLCQTFKCPKLIKAKPAPKAKITWLDRLWLASRENHDDTKGGHSVKTSLAQVTLPDLKVLESTQAAEDARIATEALKEKIQCNGLTIFNAAREEECITSMCLALQFDLEHHSDHCSQQAKKPSGAPFGGLPAIL